MTPKEGTSPVLRDALDSLLPVPGLRLTGFAAPFRGSGAQAAVTLALLVDGRDLTFKEQPGSFVGSLELSAVAMNSRGKTDGSMHSTIPMPLRPESYRMVERQGIRVVSKIDLPPGRHQLRIGAMDAGSGRTRHRRPAEGPAGAAHPVVPVPRRRGTRAPRRGVR